MDCCIFRCVLFKQNIINDCTMDFGIHFIFSLVIYFVKAMRLDTLTLTDNSYKYKITLTNNTDSYK